MTAGAVFATAVSIERIEHDLKILVRSLKGVDELDGVLHMDIVVDDAVHDVGLDHVR